MARERKQKKRSDVLGRITIPKCRFHKEITWEVWMGFKAFSDNEPVINIREVHPDGAPSNSKLWPGIDKKTARELGEMFLKFAEE